MNPTLWLSQARPYLRARAPWAAIFAFLGVLLRFLQPSPPPRTAEGVAAMLGAAVGGEVRPDDFVWETRGGAWSDAVLGRPVLFLARPTGAKDADLYRARVRLTRAGQPVSLRVVRNLTASPLGDDRDLVALGHHAAFVTTAFGAVQGVTLLDLEGEGEAREARTPGARWAAALESWLSTGSTRGLGRTEITFGNPPPEARAELQGDLLVMALGKEAQPAALELREGTLNTGPQNAFAAAAQTIPHRTPALADVAARAAGELLGAGAGRAVSAAVAALTRAPAPATRAQGAMTTGGGEPAPAGGDWPPPPLVTPLQPPREGEGAWTSRRRAPRKGDAVDAPPGFYETAIRPDPGQPEAVVRLVAIDTRQADLRLEAGVDEPRSLVGLHGGGRPPDGVAAERLTAAFSGGPAARGGARETARGEAPLGFVIGRRVFASPSPGIAAVAIAGDGHVELGPWPFGSELPPSIASLRQTPDALVGWSGPPRRSLANGGELAERSGLGLLASGQLVYAWGERVSADTLARGLALAGCTVAVPLATGPAPAGFAYLHPGGAGIEADPLSPDMALARRPFAGRAASDLFYVVTRTTAPPATSGFAPDGGQQPGPAWLPAIQSAVVISLGAQVHVTTFAPGRVAFRLRAGAREPQTKAVAALPGAISEAEQPRLVAAIGLGSGKRRGARGLVIDGVVGLPFRGEEAGALVFDHGRPRVVRASEITPSAGMDATELPLTADDGKLRPEARDVGSMRARAAACALADGTLALAATTFDSDEAATSALLELGCTRIVTLDRGSHQAAFVHRAGTETPPQPRYEGTTVYAVEIPLSGRSRRLE